MTNQLYAAKEQESYIVVLGSRNSVVSRGINARVSVSNNGSKTTVSSSFGTIEINNDLVDSKHGYVIEGNDLLDKNNCKSGELQRIIISCEGKLIVRTRTPEDSKKFGGF